MAEIKIKVKDLVTEINAPSRDVLRALRELNLPAKTTTGSLNMEEAERLRAYFANRQQDTVERSSGQVIVRRRRKDSPPVQEARPAREATSEEAPVIEKKPAQAPEEKKLETEQPPLEKPAPKPEAQPKKPVIRNVGARIISRPSDEKAAPAPELEPVQAIPEPVKDVIPRKTLAEQIREADAAREAQARAEADALKKKIERGAAIISKPTPKPEPEIPAAQPQVEEPAQAEEKVSVEPEEDMQPVQRQPSKRSAIPDASAQPQGSSAPAFSSRPEGERVASPEKQPQVRVISRPSPQQQRRPKSAVAGKSGDSAPFRQESKPGGYRNNAPRPAGFDNSFQGKGGAAQPLLQTPDKDGQSKKKRLKGRRTVDFQQGDFGRHPDDDENLRFNRGKSKRKTAKPQPQQQFTQPIKAAKRKLRVAEAIRVADMAQQMGVKANEIIKVLFGLGVMTTINQALDIDTAALVASEFGYEVEKTGFSEEEYLAPKDVDAPESLKPRPPVVTIMGHVDHGKTSLLDAIRKSNVTSGEAGGITQHIGAYHVKTKRGEIVFLDTPGHEAFTAMRARGAQITDLVILVVAADDGVMEQTREAVSHSKAANVPIMVAVNKMDKPGADPDRVLRELAELGLQPEDWGGDTIVAKVSAKTREGLDDLLELVALQSEIMDLKANPDKLARGHIVEAKLDKGRGPVATVLIQEGTLHTGDTFVCGPFAGRVRALVNDQGKKVKEAGPSIPVEVQGFDGVPEAGEEFMAVADEKIARRIADARAAKRRERDLASEARVTLETFLAQTDDKETQTLNLVIKADVQGSLEAITEALQKQSTDKVKINIVHGGAGAISESDILLANASKAIIVGFNVRPSSRIKDIAEKENVDIRYYDIIYKLVDDVKSAMAGMLAPVQKEVYLGQAEVRQVFNLPKVGAIAGSYVADGKIVRNAGARLLRDGVVTYTGKISSLKRFKEDAREVVKGNECGIGLENFNDIKVGDVIEAFETVEEAASL